MSGVTVRPNNSLLLVFFVIITSSMAACTPPQKARQPETLEATRKDSCLTLMTYNIRVGAGRENLLIPVKYLNSSGEKLEKIAPSLASASNFPKFERHDADHTAYANKLDHVKHNIQTLLTDGTVTSKVIKFEPK